MDTNQRTDVTDLVRRARSGDQRAWDAIVKQYSGLLWSVARSFRLNDAQAADAVQTTWLRLFEHADAIRDPERVPGWLRTTARRACLEVLRESSREQLVDSHTERWEQDTEPTGSHESPETALLRREHEALVRSVLDQLPDRHRRLVTMLVASGSPNYQEISRHLQMPVGSIGPTRARLLARMRERLTRAGLNDLALT